MSQWDEIDPRAIFHISWDIRDGVADPDDARRLLEHFCDCVDSNEAVSPYLLKHLRDSFRDYLSGEKKIEQSLGLKRKTGRPEADEQMRIRMAAAILEKRMEGQSHEDAIFDVEAQFGWGKTIISEAWRKYKPHALDMIRLERPHDRYPWTAGEKDRLCKIFGDEPWFIGSGNP